MRLSLIKSNKKKIAFAVIAVFIIYNVVWYQLIHSKYDEFSNGMDQLFKNSFVSLYHISYAGLENGYQYSVKYPDYLSYTGNLAISNDDNTCSILIWPSLLGKNEYGVMIQEDQENYQIMIDERMNPIDKNYAQIINRNKVQIEKLLEKSREKWNL